jgi:uncharacterized membrane protein YkoI
VIVVNAKKMIIVVAASLMLLVGAGVAYATGSGGDSSGQQATGTNLDKAKSIALEHVNGRVTGTEVGDEEGAYEVEVTKDDGSQVDVHLDKDFNVLGTPADQEGAEHESSDGKDASEDSGG